MNIHLCVSVGHPTQRDPCHKWAGELLLRRECGRRPGEDPKPKNQKPKKVFPCVTEVIDAENNYRSSYTPVIIFTLQIKLWDGG